jgi:hypothetical protein
LLNLSDPVRLQRSYAPEHDLSIAEILVTLSEEVNPKSNPDRNTDGTDENFTVTGGDLLESPTKDEIINEDNNQSSTNEKSTQVIMSNWSL